MSVARRDSGRFLNTYMIYLINLFWGRPVCWKHSPIVFFTSYWKALKEEKSRKQRSINRSQFSMQTQESPCLILLFTGCRERRLKNNVRLKILMDQGFSPNSSHPPLLELDSMFCDDLEIGWGGREAQRREDICIYIADSCFCTRETNTTW